MPCQLCPRKGKAFETVHTLLTTSFQLHKLLFALVNSTTILLPVWKVCLVELDCAVRIMPRDVQTRWNSTYDMLQFAVRYKDAIKMITSDLANGLQKYKLNDDKWLIVKELVATLKVWFRHNSSHSRVDHVCLIDASLHALPTTSLSSLRSSRMGLSFSRQDLPTWWLWSPLWTTSTRISPWKPDPMAGPTQLFDTPSRSPRRLLTGTTHWQMSPRSIELQWASLYSYFSCIILI